MVWKTYAGLVQNTPLSWKKSIWTFSALQAKCCSSTPTTVFYRSCFLITEFQDINYLVEWRLSLHYLLVLLVSMLLCSTKTGNCNHAPMVCDLLKDIWGLSLKFLVVGYFSLKIAMGHAHNCPVILLQIVMLSPGTHLVKNHESHCRANESQFKKQQVLNWNCLGLYVTRLLIWRQAPKLPSTVYWD